MTTTDPVVEFLERVLSGICRGKVNVRKDGPTVMVEVNAKEFGFVVGHGGKMWTAIKLCAFHAARLAGIDPPACLLITPDSRCDERTAPPTFRSDWNREDFLEYVAPLIHMVAPGTPDCEWASDDGESAKIRTVWDKEAEQRLANVPAALSTILASAGCHIGARIALEVVWR